MAKLGESNNPYSLSYKFEFLDLSIVTDVSMTRYTLDEKYSDLSFSSLW